MVNYTEQIRNYINSNNTYKWSIKTGNTRKTYVKLPKHFFYTNFFVKNTHFLFREFVPDIDKSSLLFTRLIIFIQINHYI